MNQEKIGKFIAQCRKDKNLTQSELADKLNITDKTVSRWENGHYLPDVSLFNDLCNILDIEVVELLNGEKLKKSIDRKEVDETINKIVSISEKEIKKNRKKIVIFAALLIILIVTLFGLILNFYNRNNNRPKTGDSTPFVSQMTLKELDDGWVCYMNIEYLKSDVNNPYFYGYNCENFKYKKISDFIPIGTEANDNKQFLYKTEVNHPEYIYNSLYSEDIKSINDYFVKNKFNKRISLNELDDLDLKILSKNDILELYNSAISNPKIYKWGNVVLENHSSYLSVSMQKDNYTWYVGYIINCGHIEYVNIELMINDVYLSDLIKENKASGTEKDIYMNIQEIRKYIMGKQKFSLPDEYKSLKPYSFLIDSFHEISNLEND